MCVEGYFDGIKNEQERIIEIIKDKYKKVYDEVDEKITSLGEDIENREDLQEKAMDITVLLKVMDTLDKLAKIIPKED